MIFFQFEFYMSIFLEQIPDAELRNTCYFIPPIYLLNFPHQRALKHLQG